MEPTFKPDPYFPPESSAEATSEIPVPPVKGYRLLTDDDVALMNIVKSKGEELIHLFQHITEMAVMKERQLYADCENAQTRLRAVQLEGDESAIAVCEKLLKESQTQMNNFQLADPMRWACIGRTDIQQGVMALVRAIAQPNSLI